MDTDKPTVSDCYYHVSRDGFISDLGSSLPQNPEELGEGAIVGFKRDTDDATKRLFLGYARRSHRLPVRKFKRNGIELHSILSHDMRAETAKGLAGIWRGTTYQAIGFILLFISLMTTMHYSQVAYLSGKNGPLVDSRSSFLGYVLETKVGQKADVDIERIKREKAEFGLWKKGVQEKIGEDDAK